jgi:hypothetical protein|nr:MAG TPA_asm: hypothetical protein [Bacteriophage sp.]
MNKKEIEEYLKRIDELENKLTGEDKETYDWLIYGYHKCIKLLNEAEEQCKRQKEVIDKSIDFIKNGDLLYLANKNSIVHRNNIEIRVVADRLNDLLQILEDKEVSE